MTVSTDQDGPQRRPPAATAGLVNVLGGKGMNVSAVAQTFPNLTRMLNQWAWDRARRRACNPRRPASLASPFRAVRV